MSVKKITLNFITLIIFSTASCINGQIKSEDYFMQAYQCKDLECQLENFDKSIELDSKYAPSYYGRAYVYFIKNEHKKKQADLNQVIELSPNYNQIITAYEKAYKFYPNNKYVLGVYGMLLMIMGEDTKAFELANLAIKIDPTFPQAYYDRGFYYENKRENEKALADYGKAIQLDSNFANALHRHGDMLAITFKDYEKGIAELNKAIELNPNFIAAYNSRAVANKLRGEYEKAIPDLNKSIELEPDNFLIYNFRASIYRELGKIDLAEKDEQKAKELQSKEKNKRNN